MKVYWARRRHTTEKRFFNGVDEANVFKAEMKRQGIGDWKVDEEPTVHTTKGMAKA